jgi:hypothetical protein
VAGVMRGGRRLAAECGIDFRSSWSADPPSAGDFLTNALIGIRPVREVAGRPRHRPMTRRLQRGARAAAARRTSPRRTLAPTSAGVCCRCGPHPPRARGAAAGAYLWLARVFAPAQPLQSTHRGRTGASLPCRASEQAGASSARAVQWYLRLKGLNVRSSRGCTRSHRTARADPQSLCRGQGGAQRLTVVEGAFADFMECWPRGVAHAAGRAPAQVMTALDIPGAAEGGFFPTATASPPVPGCPRSRLRGHGASSPPPGRRALGHALR